MSQEQQKRSVAQAALEYVPTGSVIGVGSGSTVNYFIEELATVKSKLEGAVAASRATEQALQRHHIPIVDLNSIDQLPVYIDGADEFNPYLSLIKGGGGALTREKIIAASAKQFVCMADASKQVNVLGKFPLPIEVIPMARSYVARQLVKLGGVPEYRDGFITDNGHVILDIHQLRIETPIAMEEKLNNIAGVVTVGIFAKRGADVVLMADNDGNIVRFGAK